MDFAAPVGYKEPQPEPMATDVAEDTVSVLTSYQSLSGLGTGLCNW